MKAEIIAIGTELLIGHTVNTNSAHISEELNSLGVSVLYHVTVGDNEERILESLKLANSRSDLVVITGGLGPTDDDITQETLAKFVGKELIRDEEQKKILLEKHSRFGSDEVPQISYKQTGVIDGATVIPNPIGTAIGMMLDHDDTIFITFPGVPCEMEAMLYYCIPRLKSRLAAEGYYGAIVSRKIKMVEITEALMAQNVLQHYEDNGMPNPFHGANPSLAPYASLGECYLRVTAKAESEEEAWQMVEETQSTIESIFPDNIYGYDNDTTHGLLAESLRDQGLSIAFAESCTGGLASKMMTDMPGSSDYTKLNIVTYANEAKMQMLGVSEATLNNHGAVSSQCAQEMVEGLAKISNADINVSITGIAGPDGGTAEKPVGTIYVGVIYPGSSQPIVEKLHWRARDLSRAQVRELACVKVFHLVNQLISKPIKV